MSQVPGVSIFAEVELRRTRLAQSIREVERDIRQGLARVSSQNLAVTVTTRIDPNLQRNLDQALARLTVRPIQVPVVFVPQGQPGGGGGGGGNGAGGGGGGPQPRARRQGNGAGAGGGADLDIFPGGLGRYLAPGFLAREALRLAQGGINYAIASDRAEIFNDNRMRYQAEQQLQDTIGSIPVVGQAASLMTAAERYYNEHTIAEADRADQKTSAMKTGADAARSGNHAASLMATRGVAQFGLKQQYEQEDFERNVIGKMKSEAGTQDISHAIQQARDGFARRQQQERIQDMLDRSQAGADLGDERTALISRLSADPDAAQNAELQTKQRQRAYQLRQRDPAQAARYERDIAPLEVDEQLRKQRSARERESGDSAARIESTEKQSAEHITRARGEMLAAMLSQTKRSTDERVAELEREAKFEDTRDRKRAANLRNEAAAERTAGVERQRAIMIEQEREANRQTRVTNAAATESELDAQGQHRAARQGTIGDRLTEELKQIDERYGTNPTDPKIAALRNQARGDAQTRAATARQGETARNRLADRSLVIDTADASARSRGQAHVGEVLGMQAEFEDMERDAAKDPARLAMVRDNEKARIAAMRRDLRPRSHTFGIEEYGDAIQSSISEGYRNNDAFQLLDSLGKNGGRAAGGVNAPGGVNPAQSIEEAAKDLKESANVIKNARNLGVFRRGR